jgi:hypothetical protein
MLCGIRNPGRSHPATAVFRQLEKPLRKAGNVSPTAPLTRGRPWTVRTRSKKGAIIVAVEGILLRKRWKFQSPRSWKYFVKGSYKVVQIWPGLFVCKQVTVCPGNIWTTLYILVPLAECSFVSRWACCKNSVSRMSTTWKRSVFEARCCVRIHNKYTSGRRRVSML